MVLAAGFGTRLQPLTRILPKPMFPVLGRPLLSHTFDLLRSANISEAVVNTHHLPDCITDYFANEKPSNLNLHFSHEEKILGTAGGIKKVQGLLGDGPFILINSDILTDIDLNRVIEFHKKNNSKLTLVVRQDASPEQYDPIEIGENGRIAHFVGASSMNLLDNTTRVMFTGIQIMEPEIFERIPSGQFCGTTEDVFPKMVEDSVPIYGYLYDGYWKDMGNRESYLQVNADALDCKVKLKGIPSHKPDGPLIVPPVLIGRNCRIAGNSQIGPHTVIGPNCTVKNGAVIENSVLWDGVTIRNSTTVKQSVIAANITVGEGKSINGEAVV
ncbi:MAG: NDP-sugar synthase [Nitrospinaceae bacterium]|nr:NDP-sugar synthase [Nitrospinaceae bacterium]